MKTTYRDDLLEELTRINKAGTHTTDAETTNLFLGHLVKYLACACDELAGIRAALEVRRDDGK